MHRRLFLGGALAAFGARSAAAGPPAGSSDTVAVYARRLQDGLDRTGGGRFVMSSEDDLYAAHQSTRAQENLPALATHPGLALAARAHAADQSLRSYFGHGSPEGFSVADRVGLLGRTFIGLPGENIIELKGGYLGADPQKLMSSWMDSPGHRANILRPTYTHLGLGVVQTGRRTVSVAVFGQRFAELGQPIAMAPSAADIARALETAHPAIHSYDLSPVGRSELKGAFSSRQSPAGVPPGPYTLRPRLQEGPGFTIVIGPIVELSA